MQEYYFLFDRNKKTEVLFAQNRAVFDWLQKLSDDYCCLIEFSWAGKGGQSDFMIIGKNKIVNIEVKGFKGYLKGTLNDNWALDGKNTNEKNPYKQALDTANSFKEYLQQKIFETNKWDNIKVWPIVALPNAAKDSDIPRRGQGNFGDIVSDETELIDAIEKVKSLSIEINEGIIRRIARELNLKIYSVQELKTIINECVRIPIQPDHRI